MFRPFAVLFTVASIISLALPTVERILNRRRDQQEDLSNEDDIHGSSSSNLSYTSVIEDVDPAIDVAPPRPTGAQDSANHGKKDTTNAQLKEEQKLHSKAEQEVSILNKKIEVLQKIIQTGDEVNKRRIEAHQSHAHNLLLLNRNLERCLAINERRLKDAYTIIRTMEKSSRPRPSGSRPLQRNKQSAGYQSLSSQPAVLI